MSLKKRDGVVTFESHDLCIVKLMLIPVGATVFARKPYATQSGIRGKLLESQLNTAIFIDHNSRVENTDR